METAKRSSSGGDRPPEPPAKRRRVDRDDALTSWADLGPELIGRISIFLGMGNPDLMNFLLCLGPSTSAVVRKTYLVDNTYYLDYCFNYDPSGYKTSCWLEHNEVEWKKRCQGGNARDPNVHAISFTADAAAELGLTPVGPYMSCYPTRSHSPTVVANVLRPFRLGSNIGVPILLSVGCTKVPQGASEEEVRSLIASEKPGKDGTLILRLISHMNFIFTSPVLAINYGMTDVLKHLVETGIVGINDEFDVGTGERTPLLFHAAAGGEISFRSFEYLLSCQGINVNAEVTDGQKLIHVCAGRNLVSVKMFKALLRHPQVDVNAKMPIDEAVDAAEQVSDGFTPLLLACVRKNIEKVKLLLEYGADPDILIADGDRTIDIIRERLSGASSEEERQQYEEVCAMLENASQPTRSENA